MVSPRIKRKLSSIYQATVRVRKPNGEFAFESKQAMNRCHPDYKSALTVDQGSLKAIPEKVLEALVTVMAQAATGGGGCDVSTLFKQVRVRPNAFPFTYKVFESEMTVEDFMGLGRTEQYSVIDQAWEKVFEPKAYSSSPNRMVEPTTIAGKRPVPSSFCPAENNSHAQRYKNKDGTASTPFRQMGIGFRVDGSSQSSVDRVMRKGMNAQILDIGDIRNRKGWEVSGTIMVRDTSRPRVWRGNHDLLNESSVCVARNFFGATAFPERGTNNKEAYLWAVDCSDLVGFDTEAYQTAQAGSRSWRPGEKAFQSIPKENIIGYVKFNKRGDDSQGGWKFNIAQNAAWTYLREPNKTVKDYIEGELNAWRGDHAIPPKYDFAT